MWRKIDLLQFAYEAKRRVEDGCLSLLDTVTNLDHLQPCTRIFYAFNTVNINSAEPSQTALLKWIRGFLHHRPQQ